MTNSVAEWCREQHLSVADLTQRSGLEESRVLAIVLGRWTPSPQERRAIADVFGVSANDIVWGHKTPIQHIWGPGPG